MLYAILGRGIPRLLRPVSRQGLLGYLEHLIDRHEVQVRLAVLVLRRAHFPISTLLCLCDLLLGLLRCESLDVLVALVQFLLKNGCLCPELLGHFSIALHKLFVLFLDPFKLLDKNSVLLRLQIVVKVGILLLQRASELFYFVLKRCFLLNVLSD